VASFCKYGDEPAGSGATELVGWLVGWLVLREAAMKKQKRRLDRNTRKYKLIINN
jgi:hypothetical protein